MIIIKDRRITEDFSGEAWEKIKKGTYKTARLSNKDNTIIVTFDNPRVAGSKQNINIYTDKSKLTIAIEKIKKVSAVGSNESNWELDVTDGSVLYLNT
jgi:HSP20 family molecular chaperone IbpA